MRRLRQSISQPRRHGSQWPQWPPNRADAPMSRSTSSSGAPARETCTARIFAIVAVSSPDRRRMRRARGWAA